MVQSYLESNEKKKLKASKENKEMKQQALDAKEKYENFKKLVDTDEWKYCEDFLKDEIYNALSLAPGEGGDWWLKYSWAIKACIERIKSHAKKYDDAIKFLSEQ